MKKALLDSEIELARKLKEQEGFTNRKIAYVFCVGKTTIWDAIYKKATRVRHYRNVKKIIELRRGGYTSKEVSELLSLSLEKVNEVYSKFN